METNEWISAGEASAALAAAKRSRARVAWSRYPAWYWLTTGACLGAVSGTELLPGWWALAASAVIAALLVTVARAAARARGIREGCVRSAMTRRDALALGGPAALLMLAGAFMSKLAPRGAWPAAVAAVLVFAVYAGTGLTRSARAARQ
jgi:hypothetical protein